MDVGTLQPGWLIAYVAVSLICGWYTGWLADRKRYDGTKWFFAGTFFFVFALLAMIGAPASEEASRDKNVQ